MHEVVLLVDSYCVLFSSVAYCLLLIARQWLTELCPFITFGAHDDLVEDTLDLYGLSSSPIFSDLSFIPLHLTSPS